MTRLLNTDEARLAVWQAIEAITIGNATDDKLIVANLAKAGVYLATQPATSQEGEDDYDPNREPGSVVITPSIDAALRKAHLASVTVRAATPTPPTATSQEGEDKRARVKAVCDRLLVRMREIARQDGWALAVHGSMSRDLDIVAVPWTDQASYEPALVEALRAAVAQELGGVALVGAGEDGRTPGYKIKPNGRRCYTLHSTSEQLVEDEAGAHPYVDLSILDFRLSAVGQAFGDGVYAACSAIENSDRGADDLIQSAWPDYADQYAALLPTPTPPTLSEDLREARVYLAARFSRRHECNALGHILKSHGCTITSRWVKPDCEHVLPTGISEQAADHERQRFALEDVEDVRAANWTISFMEEPRGNSRGGRHIEFGMAVALGHRLTIIGPRETVFHHLPNVEQFDTVADFTAALARAQGQAS